MEIRQLKAFLAITEAKTFTAGARRVNVTQAAISMQIRQLEDEVGLPLFTRTPRRVIITEAGEYLLERARKILREHDTALAEIAELGGAEHGRLRIGSASAMFATQQLPGIMQMLRVKFPNSELCVSSGTSNALVDKIMHGEIDTAFVSLPVENSSITADLLFSDEIVAIAHPTHRFAKERFISAAALAGEKLILGERGVRNLVREFEARLAFDVVRGLRGQDQEAQDRHHEHGREDAEPLPEGGVGFDLRFARRGCPVDREAGVVSREPERDEHDRHDEPPHQQQHEP